MELMPGYKRSDVGVIPDDWDAKPLGEIGDSLIGLTYRPSEVRKYGTLVLRSSNVQNGALCFDDNVFVDADIPERIMVRPGDILVCVRNGSRDLIGKSALIDERAIGMTFGAFMAVFRSEHGKLLHHVFQSGIFKKQITEHLGATINQITNKSLNSFQVPLPPTSDERTKIANALSDVDALVATLDKMISKKIDLKQAAMRHLLTGKTRLPGFTGAWETKQLKDLAHLSKTGINPSSTPESLFTHFSLPAFDANETPVIESGASIGSNKFVVPPGAVLLSKLNPRIPRVWAPNCIPSNSVCSTEFLVLIPNEGVDRNFFKYLCASTAVASQMELHAIGTTGSHQRIHPTQVMAIEVKTPTDDDERSAISSVLRDIDAELSNLNRRRDKTVELKQAMMQELLIGKTRLA